MRIVFLTGILLIFIFTSCKVLEKRDVGERKTLRYSEAIMTKYRKSDRPEHILISGGNLIIKDEEKSNSLRITFYSEKDALIFISGRFMGFEIFRFMFTEDSIKFINRAQRNYYFGSRNNIQNEFLKTVSLWDLQNLLYTGLLEQENLNRRTVERNFVAKVDRITYNKVLEEGVKIELQYNLAAFLEKILISNHIDSVYIDLNINRNDSNIRSIMGSYIRNNYEIKYEFEPNNISNRAYDRIDFNVGNNYNEVRNIL